jgi:cobalt-zinc-cadmium efflux system membrane fusion protein
MKNYIIPVFICLSLSACSKKDEKNKKEQEQKGFAISNTLLKTTTLAEVQKEYIRDETRFFGKIGADRNQYIDIYPLVGGNVLNVFVELGDYVKKGQPLATIRSTEIADFQRDLSNAKTNMAVAENNLRVASEMYEGKLSTEKDVLEAKSEVTKARDELRRSQQVNQIYNVRNGNIYLVTSPISGYIVQKNINKDMQLRSDRSDNIFDVANTSNVWAIVNVNESDINKIGIGMKAEVSTLIDPEKIYHGKIDKIFKIINPETNSMQARVVLDNTYGTLIPESKATIKVINIENNTALSIPTKALIFDDNKYFVVLFKSQNNIKVQEVKVLKQTNDRAFISEGLSEGDKVVTTNQLLLYRNLNE